MSLLVPRETRVAISTQDAHGAECLWAHHEQLAVMFATDPIVHLPCDKKKPICWSGGLPWWCWWWEACLRQPQQASACSPEQRVHSPPPWFRLVQYSTNKRKNVIWWLISWLINLLFGLLNVVKGQTGTHHNFPRPKMMSSNYLFHPDSESEAGRSTSDKEKQQICTEKLKPRNFCWKFVWSKKEKKRNC